MRIGRLLSAMVSVSLFSAPLAVVAAPAASAAETFPTRTVIAVEKNKMRFNDTFDVEGQVVATAPDGKEYGVEDASIALQRRFPGRTWKTIRQAKGNGYNGAVAFRDVKAVQNAGYRLKFAGETRDYSGNTATFSPSVSKAKAVRVARDITMSGTKRAGRMYVFGKVKPTFKRKVVQIQRKTCASCRWKPWAKVRTTKRSTYRRAVAVPSSGTWYYRAFVPKTSAFIGSPSRNGWKVWRY